eukprot:6490199-Amphidinium_carterae.2
MWFLTTSADDEFRLLFEVCERFERSLLAAAPRHQEHLFKEYDVSKYNQILYINAASSVTSMSALIAGGGFKRSLEFASRSQSICIAKPRGSLEHKQGLAQVVHDSIGTVLLGSIRQS